MLSKRGQGEGVVEEELVVVAVLYTVYPVYFKINVGFPCSHTKRLHFSCHRFFVFRDFAVLRHSLWPTESLINRPASPSQGLHILP